MKIGRPAAARSACGAALLALAAGLAGCNRTSDAELMASAERYLANREPRSATLQLKTLLQHDPKSAQARYLLGTALLATGDAAAATVEFEKAVELKFDENKVLPPLARSLLLQGSERKLVETYGSRTLGDPKADADLKVSVAAAMAKLGKADEAEAAASAVLKSQPDQPQAKLLLARLAARRNDTATALRLLDEATQASPGDADAWLLKAEIQQHASHDNAAALESYRKAVAQRKDLMAAHQGIVSLLVAAKDLDGADAHVRQLAKDFPNQPMTKLLQAQMAFLRKDFKLTRELVQPLVQQSPNNPIVLQLAGAAEYELKSLPQAENLLAQAVRLAPGMPLATLLLARTQMRDGQPEKALDTLRPNLDSDKPWPEALLAAGEAYLQSGDAAKAEAMFARAAKLRPQDTRARVALALGKTAKGPDAAGMADLESLASTDSGTTADLALIAAHLRRNEADQALKAIDALDRKKPDQPIAPNLRGRVLLAKKDLAGARSAFDTALSRDPKFFPAIANLAAIDVAEKKPEAARQRFESLLKTDPDNFRALMALGNLRMLEGAPPKEVGDLLERAVKAAPNEVAPRLQLIGFHLRTDHPKSAIDAGQAAVAALPSSLPLNEALGRALLAGGEYQQAVTTFNKLSTLQPKGYAAQLGLADAYLGLKNYEAAERSLRRALEVAPQLQPARQSLVQLLAGDGRFADAVAVAKDLQRLQPSGAAGWVMEGDIEAQRRNWDAAITAYRHALQNEPSANAAIKVVAGLQAADRGAEADRFVAGWLADHPKDAAFRFYLGDAALARKDWPKAEAAYRDVLRLQPDNALALNNVAWLMVRQSKPGATALAQKATQLMPGRPQLVDTLAQALAAEGQLPRALELQKQAVGQQPDDPTLRLTLARLLIRSGDKAGARVELEQLAKLGKKFPDHAEVAELLKAS